jgi:hypothetical protein
MKFKRNSATDIAVRLLAIHGPMRIEEIRAQDERLSVDKCRGLSVLLAERVQYGELAVRKGTRVKKYRIKDRRRVATLDSFFHRIKQ